MAINRQTTIGHSPNPWIFYPKPNPNAKIKLFCFPYAGGGSQIFQNWPGKLPEEVELVMMQLPGRGRRFIDPLCKSVKEFVEGMVPAMLPEFNKPYMLFGHSMGALLVFELVRYLRKHRHKLPMATIVAGRCAPQVRDKEEETFKLSDEDFKKKVANMEGTPKEVLENKELMDLLLPLLRSDFQVSESYKYYFEDPLPCEILALGGDSDANCTPDELMAWQEQTTNQFQHQFFDGGHFFIHSKEDELLKVLSEKLSEYLAKAGLR